METNFIKTWANLNQRFNTKLLYDFHENQFYFLRRKLADGSLELSPLTTPTEKINVDSEMIMDLDSYISGNFNENQPNFNENSKKNQGGFKEIQTDFNQIQGSFKENQTGFNQNQHVFNPFQTPFAPVSNQIQLDKILNESRQIAGKIRANVKGKRNKSWVKSMELEKNAHNWYLQGDIEELKYTRDRLKGLHGAVNNAKGNFIKGKQKKRNKRVLAVVLSISLFISVVGFGAYKGYARLKQNYSEFAAVNNYMHEGDNMHPDSLAAIIHQNPKLNRIIDGYAAEKNVKVWNWRRAKIIYSLKRHENLPPIAVIDSVFNRKYDPIGILQNKSI